MYMRQKSWVRYFDRASVVHIVQMCWDTKFFDRKSEQRDRAAWDSNG